MMMKCSMERGLARVFNQVLGFEGNEFHIKAWPQLIGKQFGDILYAFEDAIPVGFQRSRNDGTRDILLNPLVILFIYNFFVG